MQMSSAATRTALTRRATVHLLVLIGEQLQQADTCQVSCAALKPLASVHVVLKQHICMPVHQRGHLQVRRRSCCNLIGCDEMEQLD